MNVNYNNKDKHFISQIIFDNSSQVALEKKGKQKLLK